MDLSVSSKRDIFNGMLEPGFAFRMKGDEPFQSDSYHVFVVLNRNPKTGECLILANSTSKVDKRKRTLNSLGIDPEKTTVMFKPGDYSFITKETIFDCNSINTIDIKDIPFAGDQIRFLSENMREDDVQRLVAAVKNSPRVEPKYKSLL